MTQLDDLIAVAHQLRAPGGCPWDAEQTHDSLTKYLLEETYELLDAIESGNRDEVIEELGDVLWYIAAMSRQLGFTLDQIGEMNLQKLADRKARGVLKSEGDNR